MPGSVLVIGSITAALVVTLDRLPEAGETVGGGRFARHGGGKGANQAVAAARLGARVRMGGGGGAGGMGGGAGGARWTSGARRASTSTAWRGSTACRPAWR